MDMSSPLAAMRPPPPPGPWGYRRDLPSSKSLFGPYTLGPKNFDFREMSMRTGSGDYFSAQPMRGSSPTASLAADMSSNLHVDQSPQLATPRRSLFTTNIFQQLNRRSEGTTTPPIQWEGVTTPPIASSSPCFAPDTMDMSPLPHKAPFGCLDARSRTNPLPSPSPSPDFAPNMEDDMLSFCEPPTPPQFPTIALEAPRPVSAVERRKSNLCRPSLSRMKNYSTNTVSFKTQENSPLSAFKFGCGDFSTASSLTLDECFAASPPQERRPGSNGSLFASRPRPSHANTVVLSRVTGSPLAAIRKPAGLAVRRPSKIRRSLSMYEHPSDVVNANQDQDSYGASSLDSVMDIDVDEAPRLRLPHEPVTEPEGLPRINRDTLVKVLDGVYDEFYDKKTVIDCRFEYEYKGGHIEGALNFCEKDKLAESLFGGQCTGRTLLILHCEYSAHRAPIMAQFVRAQDRKENAHQYPQLSYPELYILDGGYSNFYFTNPTRCYPQNYLRMDDKKHEQSCERGLNRLKQRAKLSRAQTFAFGQSCQMQDSPTAVGRTKGGNNLFMLCDDSPNVGRIGATRRMASY